MFIDEQEFQRRIRSSENILNRVPRDSERDLTPDSFILPIDSSISVESEPEAEDPVQEAKDLSSPSGRALQMLLAGEINEKKRRGRTIEEQAGIGLASALLGPAASGRLNGVSCRHAVNLHPKTAVTATDNAYNGKGPREDLREKILEQNGVVVDLAFGRLVKSLSLLDDTKLTEVKKATDLSRIARDFSGIIKNATPQDEMHGGNSVHFHVYRPEMKQENEYETLTLNVDAESE